MTNAENRVDREGWIVMRSRRQRGEEYWRSLSVVEITFTQTHVRTFPQFSSLFLIQQLHGRKNYSWQPQIYSTENKQERSQGAHSRRLCKIINLKR